MSQIENGPQNYVFFILFISRIKIRMPRNIIQPYLLEIRIKGLKGFKMVNN